MNTNVFGIAPFALTPKFISHLRYCSLLTTRKTVDVTRRLFGRKQVIDITDERTGLPHDVAKKNMYVIIIIIIMDVGNSIALCTTNNGTLTFLFVSLLPPLSNLGGCT